MRSSMRERQTQGTPSPDPLLLASCKQALAMVGRRHVMAAPPALWPACARQRGGSACPPHELLAQVHQRRCISGTSMGHERRPPHLRRARRRQWGPRPAGPPLVPKAPRRRRRLPWSLEGGTSAYTGEQQPAASALVQNRRRRAEALSRASSAPPTFHGILELGGGCGGRILDAQHREGRPRREQGGARPKRPGCFQHGQGARAEAVSFREPALAPCRLLRPCRAMPALAGMTRAMHHVCFAGGWLQPLESTTIIITKPGNVP